MCDLGHALLKSLTTEPAAAHARHDVQLAETHISWVLLADDHAWKIKKPVDLGFVDFSTLPRRRHFCEEELRLNRRLAPDLYLDVVPITGDAREPVLDGDGMPIDYAVKMRRFPQDQLLREMLHRGELLSCHVDDLAETVARFHQQIDVAPPDSEFGSPAAVWQPVEENFEHLDRHINDPARRDRLEVIQQQLMQQWPSLAAECSARRADGFVRECHGDMHLGNIVLLGGRPTVFDGIDFNPALRWIDVVSETAFVVMDLETRGRRDLAFRFLNRYCEVTGDYDGVRLLPFYVAYRALVRAKVQAIRLAQQSSREAPSQVEQHEFDSLLRLALASTDSPKPHLLITHGLSGTGKTTFTQSLLERVGGIRIRSDVERKRLERSDALKGDLYSGRASQQTYERLEHLAERLLPSPFPVIVDATFLKRAQRDAFRRLAERHGAGFTIIDFRAPTEVLKSRVRQRQAEGRDASDADADVIDWQQQEPEPLTDDERASAFVVDTTCDTPAQIEDLDSAIGAV